MGSSSALQCPLSVDLGSFRQTHRTIMGLTQLISGHRADNTAGQQGSTGWDSSSGGVLRAQSPGASSKVPAVDRPDVRE